MRTNLMSCCTSIIGPACGHAIPTDVAPFAPGSFLAAAWYAERSLPVPTVTLDKPRHPHWCETGRCTFLGHFGAADMWHCTDNDSLFRIRDEEVPSNWMSHPSTYEPRVSVMRYRASTDANTWPASLVLADLVVAARI